MNPDIIKNTGKKYLDKMDNLKVKTPSLNS